MRLNDYKALQDFLPKGAAVIALEWDKKQSKACGCLGSGPGWAKVSQCAAVIRARHWGKAAVPAPFALCRFSGAASGEFAS